MTTTAADSTEDTERHIARVAILLGLCCINLCNRAEVHDASKLKEPEKTGFDEVKAKLSQMQYGTAEYMQALDDLKPTLDHHYAANSHHPEHWKNGVDGMSLFDVMEMLMDWKAATERMKGGGDIRRSLKFNTTRFQLSPQLASILANTIKEMGW